MLLPISFFGQKTNIEKSGDIIQIGLPVTAFASQYIFKNSQTNATQFIKSMGASFIITHSLKRLINKERPNGGDYAFPSGHTSAAFTGAAFIDEKYGLKYGIPAYILASYVGWTRVYAKKHDYIDIIGGIMVGVGSVNLFLKKNKNMTFNMNFNRESIFCFKYNF